MHRSVNSDQMSCQVIDWRLELSSNPHEGLSASALCMCCTWVVSRSCDKSSALYISHACQGLCRSQRGKHPSILPASLVSCHPYANTIPGDAWSPSSVPFWVFLFFIIITIISDTRHYFTSHTLSSYYQLIDLWPHTHTHLHSCLCARSVSK